MKKRSVACLALAAALLAAPGRAQERLPVVSPGLAPLLARPEASIPSGLRGPLGAGQGRKKLEGREALSLHLRTSASRAELEALGVHVRTLRNGRATITVLPEDLPKLAADPRVFSITLPRQVHPVLSKSLLDTGVPPMRTLSNGSFTGADGEGVIVGVIDSGIDFDHPNFEDAQGNTRIAYLWDQTKKVAGKPSPAPFNHGTEWTAIDIDSGQCTELDDPASFGHGTHVTGTAAGNGAAPDENGNPYRHIGVAPESTIIFVKTSGQTDDIIDGFEYIFAKADQLGLPAVINLSMGTDIGAHDGTGPMEQAIDDLVTAKPGRAVVVAAGNSRARNIHAEVKAQAGTTVAGPTIIVPAYAAKAGSVNDFIVLSGYYPAGNDVSVQLISPTGEAYNHSLQGLGDGCLGPISGFDGRVLICNSPVSILDQATTAREIYIEIVDGLSTKPPKSGSWKLNVTGETLSGSTAEVDFWMFSSLGQEKAYFGSLVDPHETVSIPGTSKQAITVGSHNTQVCWENYLGTAYPANPEPLGDVSYFSGFGPTRDGRGKPEISAPGHMVIAPLAAEAKNTIINGGAGALIINDHYLALQGTSMAAPHVTGAVALLLQEDPAATNATLRSRLAAAARQDSFTRAHDEIFGLNYAFGAGKLDLGSWKYNDPQESNDLPSQAFPILSGQELSGFIERSDDVDYFLIEGVEWGDKLNIGLTDLPANYSLSLQSQELTFVNACAPGVMYTKASSLSAGTQSERISHTSIPSPLPEGPPSFLRVSSVGDATNDQDSYLIKALLIRPEQAAAHASAATAQKLPEFVEMRVTGQISAMGEQDFYSFTAWAGKTITIEQTLNKSVSLRDANGNAIPGVPAGSLVTYTVPSSGGISLLFPKKLHAVASGATTGGYTLRLMIQ